MVADFLKMTDEEIAQITVIEQPPISIKERKGEELYLHDLNPKECYVWRTLYRRAFLEENGISLCQESPAKMYRSPKSVI